MLLCSEILLTKNVLKLSHSGLFSIEVNISVCCHRFVQSKSNSTRQLLEFILQLQIFEQVMTGYFKWLFSY